MNETASLSELAAERGLVGGPFGSSLVSSDYVDSGVPVVRGQNMLRRYIGGDFAHVTPQKFQDDLARNSARAGDVVFTQRGTLGQVSMVPPDGPDNYVISQSQMRLRTDPGKAVAAFVYYACTDTAFRRQISQCAIATGVPHINLGILSRLRVPMPVLHDQRAIAEVLGALDDKIAVNSAILDTADELVDLLFRRSAIEMTSLQPLGEIAMVTKGVSYRRSDLSDYSPRAMVTLKSITRTGTYSPAGLKGFTGEFRRAQRVRTGEIIVAQTDLTQAADVIGRAVRVSASSRYSQLVASLDLAIVRPSGSLPQEFLLGILRDDRFRQHCRDRSSGTTVLHLGKGAIESYPAPTAGEDAQRRFAETARPMYESMDSLTNQSRSLGAVRDALLPELLSGRLSVKDAEGVVEGMV